MGLVQILTDLTACGNCKISTNKLGSSAKSLTFRSSTDPIHNSSLSLFGFFSYRETSTKLVVRLMPLYRIILWSRWNRWNWRNVCPADVATVDVLPPEHFRLTVSLAAIATAAAAAGNFIHYLLSLPRSDRRRIYTLTKRLITSINFPWVKWRPTHRRLLTSRFCLLTLRWQYIITQSVHTVIFWRAKCTLQITGRASQLGSTVFIRYHDDHGKQLYNGLRLDAIPGSKVAHYSPILSRIVCKQTNRRLKPREK